MYTVLLKHTANIARALILAAGMLPFSYCSPRTGRSLLTFFFDGVPASDSTIAAAGFPGDEPMDSVPEEAPVATRDSTDRVVHDPYAAGECAYCHDPASLGSMVEPQPGLCYMCHEEMGSSYPSLHGPVAGGYCTACHHPHESRAPHLLRHEGDALCVYCHRRENIVKNEMHQDLDGMQCMDCHNPHGGEDRYILY
jgi:predicted CXXCH cytochrome family protein